LTDLKSYHNDASFYRKSIYGRILLETYNFIPPVNRNFTIDSMGIGRLS